MATRHSELYGPRSDRPHQPRRSWWRLAVLLVAGLITAGVVYSVTMVSVAVEEISEPIAPEVAPEVRPAPVQLGQRINILAMGLDDDRLRSDTIILVSIDPDTGKVGVLQIPRDTRAFLAGKGTYEKINAAYAYGVGDKRFPGNLRALKTVEDLLDIQIHYTVVIDLEAFRKAIDELGGVVIDIPFAMDYDDPDQDLSIHFEPGRQKLDGKQALEFVRWRHNNDGTGYPDGDLGRIRTQQKFLRAVMDEALKPTNLPLLPKQASTIAKYVETTMEPSRILSMAKLAATMKKDSVEFATLPGTDAYIFDPHYNKRLSFYLADPEATTQLVDRMVRGIDPQLAGTIQVEIEAPALDEPADRVVKRLTGQGFHVTVAPSLAAKPEKTRVVDLRGDDEKAQLVGRSLAAQGLSVEIVTQPDSAATADVRVLLGKQE